MYPGTRSVVDAQPKDFAYPTYVFILLFSPRMGDGEMTAKRAEEKLLKTRTNETRPGGPKLAPCYALYGDVAGCGVEP